MGIRLATKTINEDMIHCNQTFQVTLGLLASPDITDNPTDILLVLDRSGSMTGKPLADLKTGARAFVEIIAAATGGTDTIEGGSHIGIVSFSDQAALDVPLSTSVTALTTAITALQADGRTNHGDAFEKAIAAFENTSDNPKILVMFTDGKTTAGTDPDPIAAAAKAMGITIYMIGLIGDDGIDIPRITLWASLPSADHVIITPDSGELEELFKDLARQIVSPGATDIQILETLNADFQIVSINTITKGAVVQTGPQTLRWEIDELAALTDEEARLTFTARFIGTTSGLKAVNASITYEDKEGNSVTFPDPLIQADCGLCQCVECSPKETAVTAPGCQDTITLDLDQVHLESTGRIAQVRVTLKNVCPEKRVALALQLLELDEQDQEIKRGMKFFTIPAHHGPNCRDVDLRCIRFILPDLSCPCGASQTGCRPQIRLIARAFAHYIDFDFDPNEDSGSCQSPCGVTV